MAIGSFETTPIEMVQAYTAFANNGVMSKLTSILEIYDHEDHRVFAAQNKQKRVLTPEISFLTTSLLQSVINNGTGAGARSRGFRLPAAGKTGTSHDGWFAGYTPDLLCIVWVGFDDNSELNLAGSRSALPIWTEFMKRAVSIRPLSGDSFPVPEGIVEAVIDPSTGMLATDRCLQRQKEYFIKGTEPTIYCYGNPYEPSGDGNAPISIYSSSSHENEWDMEDSQDENSEEEFTIPSFEIETVPPASEHNTSPRDIYVSPSKVIIWDDDNANELQE